MTTPAVAEPPDPTRPDPTRPAQGEGIQDGPAPAPPRPDRRGTSTPAPLPPTAPAPAPAPAPTVQGNGSGRDRRSRRPAPDDRRDWVVDLGMTVGGLAAIVASFTTLRHLGHYTGWGRLDWLLPTTLDTFVITSTRVWQSRRTKSAKVRRFAAWNAIGAIALSLAGNAVYHAIHAGAWEPGRHLWLLVVLVSSIPPIAIGLISHLAVLLGRDAEFAAEEAPQPAPDSQTPPRPAPKVQDVPAPPQADPAPTDPTRSDRPAPTPLENPDPDPGAGGADSDPAQPARPDPGAGDQESGDPATRPGNDGRDRAPRPAPTGKGEDDPLLPDALAYAAEHFERTGRKIGAEPLATHFGIGTKRSRLLRDAVHGIREVESGGGA